MRTPISSCIPQGRQVLPKELFSLIGKPFFNALNADIFLQPHLKDIMMVARPYSFWRLLVEAAPVLIKGKPYLKKNGFDPTDPRDNQKYRSLYWR